jgi:lysozyme
MMQASEECIRAIKQFEGFSPVAYKDPAGVWTCGYGQTFGVSERTRMSELVADGLLRGNLRQIAAHISQAVTVPLTQKQFDALVDFEYNLGRGALETSTLLKLLNKKQYAKAAAEFPRWVHAGDNVLPGLLKRRLTEQSWFEAGFAPAEVLEAQGAAPHVGAPVIHVLPKKIA